MKIFILVVLFCLQLTNVFSQCANTANVYSFTFNGKLYEVIKENKSWNNAATCAIERGGYLVEINSLAEQNAVYDAIINGAGVSSTYVTINNGGGIAYVWIGASDKNTEGTWIWDGNNDNVGVNFWTGQGANGTNNGTAIGGSYINWGGTSVGSPKEPDNYGANQDKGAIALAGWPSGTTSLGIAGEWNDIIETSSIYYVVEYNQASGMILNKNIDFEVYPNPTNDILYIKGKNIENIMIVDLAGRVIGNYKSFVIDVSNYNKGIYFVKIYSEDKIHIDKIIIQ